MKEWKGTLIWVIGFLGGGLSAILFQYDYMLLSYVATAVSSGLATILYHRGKE
ncbi:MAG: hypothetical protein GY804_10010 [Alphaproteobacteria bacterium]|nr:hypothetical protein [Alphaproteobacteria bacterium]